MAAVKITSENFNEVVSGELPALVEFQAPWCTYCRRIGPAFAKIAQQYEGRLQVGEINIDDSPELAERFNVEPIPTLMVFSGGEPPGSLVAPGAKAENDELLRQHLEL